MRWQRRILDRPELLDDPRVENSIRIRALREVERANTYFGGHRVLARELRNVVRGWRSRTASVLDVGTGSGGIARLIRREGRQRGVTLTTVGIDLHAGLARVAQRNGILAVCGDALSLPFVDGSVDVAICSLLLHHFGDEDAITLMRELVRVALHGKVCCFCKQPLLDNDGFEAGNADAAQITEKLTIHHNDGNHDNNDPRNHRFCHQSCHKAHHARIILGRVRAGKPGHPRTGGPLA